MAKERPQHYSSSTSSSFSTSKSSADSTDSAPYKRRRTRSGCVTCRDRHIKCDENLPVCYNCLRSKRVCYRGLRLNFTQYTFYDPQKDSPCPEVVHGITLLPHRILDQSITIAALYNGLEKYKPYMHLHSLQDLRDSDLEYQDDNYLASNDPILANRPINYPIDLYSSHNKKPERTIESSSNTLYESASRYNQATQHALPESSLSYLNQDALNHSNLPQLETNLPSLSNNSQQPLHTLQYTSMPAMQVTSTLNYTNLEMTNPSTVPLSYDLQHYINLLVKEQFYWLLDQFNDFHIWQNIIPVVCMKEKDNFLFSCLMNCSRDSTISDAIDLEFLIDFQNFKYNQVKDIEIVQTTNLSLFETLLISVCLVLLGIYLKVPHDNLTTFHKQVLNNQSNLFDQLLAKLFIYFFHSGNTERSLIISSCIQSITILKFFMNKYYDLAFLHKQPTSYMNVLADVDLSSFIKFNSYEINYLNISYQNIDITSYPSNREPKASSQNVNLVNPSTQEQDASRFPQTASETKKLKHLLWYLIKLDYIINFPAETSQFSTYSNADQVLDPHLQAVNPEQLFTRSSSASYDPRPIARSILQNFTFKLLNMNNGMIIQQSNLSIQQLFEMSRQRSPEDELNRQQWSHYFGWALRYVNPS
ncbi:hypothetical protein CANMA_004015 [Candida margitis]|uniref:uncharacterized protein n=1 Tax=Candida margitis TaxID=1775924 RepID=UPI002227CE09|nr:uncharacterized protein CANMA_004015 [Candida margitis]KAI5960235.1 hypothetical protein CANMA_004015 [Candida margitis]